MSMAIAEAVERAVEECIEEGILKEFLLENKQEVIDSCIFEFYQQLFIEMQTDEAREDVEMNAKPSQLPGSVKVERNDAINDCIHHGGRIGCDSAGNF